MVLAEKLGGRERPTSENPYPIYDQNLRFSLPWLWHEKNFSTLFISGCCGWHSYSKHNLWKVLFMVLSIIMQKKLLKNVLNSRPECRNHTLFLTKMAKMDALFVTKTANHTLWGCTYLKSPDKWVPSPRDVM